MGVRLITIVTGCSTYRVGNTWLYEHITCPTPWNPSQLGTTRIIPFSSMDAQDKVNSQSSHVLFFTLLHVVSPESFLRFPKMPPNVRQSLTSGHQDTALVPPPPGVTSNFVDPPSNGLPFFVVTSILLVLVVVSVINRVYAKAFIIRKWTMDDCEF